MGKLISVEQAVEMVKPGSTLMVGGFLGCGNAFTIVDALVAKGTRDLTLIANDSAFPDVGIGKLVVNKQIKKLIASHIGTNPETGRQMIAGEMEVVLVPQGTLAEQIACGGKGLGGFLTPTGVGTIVEEGKSKLVINGKSYVLELPLRANVALLSCDTADKAGNLIFRRSERNFNPLMAMAADIVIAEARTIIEIGEMEPDHIMVPGVVVDYIVQGGKA